MSKQLPPHERDHGRPGNPERWCERCRIDAARARDAKGKRSEVPTEGGTEPRSQPGPAKQDAPPSPATEEQAKIREAAQAIINRWDDPKWEWDKHGHTAGLIADLRNALDASPPIVGEPVAWMRDDGAAQAPQSFPAPSVIEAIELMEAYEQAGGDGWWKAWDKVKAAAKTSLPLVTAPKHLNLEDEARVWYGDNYDYVTASNQHAIRMLAAFASHVLSLSTAAQGVTVDQIMEVVKWGNQNFGNSGADAFYGAMRERLNKLIG